MSAAVRLPDRAMEFPFAPADHQAIARIAYDEAGIVLPPAKAQLVYGRLARRVRACALPGFAPYVALIERDEAERARAIDALTTNHTSFFREPHHFQHFMAEVWPQLDDRLAAGERVRLWSAACSSGEEPYSLVMAALGKDRRAADYLAQRDFRVLASDLSGAMLQTARIGRYCAETVATVPAELRTTWLARDGGELDVLPEVQALIAFRQLNLLRPWPMRRPFDAIFCRNVLIYFDDATKARLQARLADALVPGGTLYLGHSERLCPEVAHRFTCVGRTTFQKVGR